MVSTRRKDLDVYLNGHIKKLLREDSSPKKDLSTPTPHAFQNNYAKQRLDVNIERISPQHRIQGPGPSSVEACLPDLERLPQSLSSSPRQPCSLYIPPPPASQV